MLKQRVKSIQKGSITFSKKFPNVSASKLLEGIFVGLQIREVLMDIEIQKAFSPLEFKAWLVFKWICANFPGNSKSHAYKDGVASMLVKKLSVACL